MMTEIVEEQIAARSVQQVSAVPNPFPPATARMLLNSTALMRSIDCSAHALLRVARLNLHKLTHHAQGRCAGECASPNCICLWSEDGV